MMTPMMLMMDMASMHLRWPKRPRDGPATKQPMTWVCEHQLPYLPWTQVDLHFPTYAIEVMKLTLDADKTYMPFSSWPNCFTYAGMPFTAPKYCSSTATSAREQSSRETTYRIQR